MAKRPPEIVEADLAIDLDALWAGVADKLEQRGIAAGVELVEAERLFWQELGATDDWLKVATAAGSLELVAVLAPAFERRFIAKALRLAGRAYVRSA